MIRTPPIFTRTDTLFPYTTPFLSYAFIPPAVMELGNATGFDFELQDQAGLGHDKLLAARNQLLGMAAKDPDLVAVRPNGQEDTPQLQIDVDQAARSEEHTSELQSLMRISYAVFCLKKKQPIQ